MTAMATIKDETIGALIGRVCVRARKRGLHYGTTYRVCHQTARTWLSMAHDCPLIEGLKQTLVSQLANAHNISTAQAREVVDGY